MGWTAEDSRRGQETLILPLTPTPALGLTEPLIQWASGAISSRVRESSAEVKNGGAISPLPHMPSWHSA
jgi:hypothetical protein